MIIYNNTKINALIICIFLGVVGIVFNGCGSDRAEDIPDVSDITLDYKLVRFDELLASMDTNNIGEEIKLLEKKQPDFYKIFFKSILSFDVLGKEDFEKNLHGFLTDSRILKLQDTVAIVFSDFEKKTMQEIDEAMRFMKYYFPDFKAPNIYTYTSEYTYQRFLFQDKDRDGLGIGLDMFLGSDYPYKALDPNNPAFSQYLTRTFSEQHITKKAMDLLIDDRLGRPPGSRLIDHMIHNGKKMYIMNRILPTAHDSILLEYTTEQTKWVKENELQIWAFFFDQNLFYESNAMKINKYISPSPSSPGMPKKAPGRVANYIGWKIVEAYMKKFPDTSMEELIHIKDSQEIMDKSRYKPR